MPLSKSLSTPSAKISNFLSLMKHNKGNTPGYVVSIVTYERCVWRDIKNATKLTKIILS